jgi:hypothetical protein
MPSDLAKISIITGDQGGGKSTVGTAFAVTDYFTKLNGLIYPNGSLIKAKSVAESVNKSDYDTLKKSGIKPNVLKYARIYSKDGKQSKLIKIPPECKVVSPVHIFSNYHLYGIKYIYADMSYIIEYMNTNLFYEAWILFDESGSTSARRSMETVGKLGAEFSTSIRKRNANFLVMTQYTRMTDLWIRLFATTRINCTYDKYSKLISCDGTREGEDISFEVYAPDYWPFFDTEEIIETPQYRIDRALQQIYKQTAAVG